MPLVPRKRLGKVSCVPNKQACYVRVSLPQDDGLPLSIKATFTGFNRTSLEKNTWVEVERSDARDARRYRVLRFFNDVVGPVKPKVEALGYSEARNCAFDPPQGKTTADDRVKFYLGGQYLAEGRTFKKIQGILWSAFGLCAADTHSWMVKRSFSQPSYAQQGKWILCRPDQFARFLIHRNDQGIQNGFKDLQPKLGPVEPEKDVYGRVSRKLDHYYGMSEVQRRYTVKETCDLLGLTVDEIDERLGVDNSAVIDVSDR